MKMIVSINSGADPRRILEKADGILIGTAYSLLEKRNEHEIRELASLAHEMRKKIYLATDDVIHERELANFETFINEINDIVDGYVIGDLGALMLLKNKGKELFFDAGTLLSNSLDATFFRLNGAHPIAARELTIEEIVKMSEENTGDISLFLIGRIVQAVSNRYYLSAYFEKTGIDKDPKAKKYFIKEENRDELMPIVESERGSRILTGEIVLALKELAMLKDRINSLFINGDTLNNDLLYDLVDVASDLDATNAAISETRIQQRYPNEIFGHGYLYKKTNITR